MLSCYCAVLISRLTVNKIAMPFEDLQGFLHSEYKLAQYNDSKMQIMKDALKFSSE